MRFRFYVRVKRKCIIFCQKMVAATAVERQHCVFQTSLDFEKNKTLLNLSMYFSKMTYHRLYLGKIWKNRWFDDATSSFDIYWHWLISILICFSFYIATEFMKDLFINTCIKLTCHLSNHGNLIGKDRDPKYTLCLAFDCDFHSFKLATTLFMSSVLHICAMDDILWRGSFVTHSLTRSLHC